MVKLSKVWLSINSSRRLQALAHDPVCSNRVRKQKGRSDGSERPRM